MDFHAAFAEIDTDNSGEITRDELEIYMRKKNYKPQFVEKWLFLFDIDGDGSITYEEYCSTLGLEPKTLQPEAVVEPQMVSSQLASSSSSSQPCQEIPKEVVKDPPVEEPAATPTQMEKEEVTEIVEIKSGSTMKQESLPVVAMPITPHSSSQGKKRTSHYCFNEANKPPKKPTLGEKEQPTQGRRPRAFLTQEPKKKHSLRKNKCFKDHTRRLRKSITPGTVLILLVGRHRGKRVICLKQLASGLLLVTGPHKLNAVPLRRAHQKFVIATSKKVDIENSVILPERLTDEYFAHDEADQPKSSNKSDNLLERPVRKSYSLSEDRKTAQKEVDKQLLKVIQQMPDASMFKAYLRTPFSLTNHSLPHKMKF